MNLISFQQSFLLAQGLSTEGKEFWVGYLTNWNQNTNNPVVLELYISADDTTKGVVSMPLVSSFTPIEFIVYPNSTRKINIPTSLAMASGSNIIENKGVHIATENNVSVYAMNKRQYSADMTVVLPTYSLGNNYFVLSHWEDGNRNNNSNSDSEFMVVAITDSTEVEITPTAETINGNPANIPFRITLQKGQTYQLRAKEDLTGSQIFATSQGGCQNFAVFSGNMYTQVGECNVQNGHDHLYAQMYPSNTLGKDFIVVPLENRYGGDIIKFLATQDNTMIVANEQTYNLDKGEFIKILSASVLTVKSDKSIAIGQYSRTMDCDGTLGDPFLIPISPNEQMLTKITFNAPSIATLSLYSLNIISKKEGTNSITFDGASIGNKFIELPESDYAYARINTYGGNHTIRSQDGFIAYVYGFGHNESFGYATGASLGNLNIDFSVNDQNEETPIDSLCLGSEISFQSLADTIYTLFEYNFGDGTSFMTDKDTAVYHTYDQVGEYLVSLKASTGGDDCSNGNEEIALKIIRIIEPSTQIFGPRSVCPNTTDVAYYLEDNLENQYQWYVEGGNFASKTNDEIHIDWLKTNNNAHVKLLGTNRYGCISDTMKYPVKINIRLDPEAPFGPDTLCSSDIVNIPYTTYYTNFSTYEWQTDFGNIAGGNNTNEVSVDWETFGIGNLWFKQISITDTVCDGISDTLAVYIQRNPSEVGEIKVEKDTFLLGEPIVFALDVDTLYKFANWELDDGTLRDTIDTKTSIDHTFLCEGLHIVSAVAYDTGTICSDTKVLIEKQIFILAPQIEILNVTQSTSNSDALEINWIMKDHGFYPKKLYLYRSISGMENWQLIAVLDANQTSYTDAEIKINEFSYDYKIETNADCEHEIATKIHQSILLTSEREDSTAAISWNNYIDWQHGVSHYEIWVSIDSGNFELLESTSDLQIGYSPDNKGFDHCFSITAIENDGNSTSSKSNTSCVSFVPEIHTYNIITPNSDKFNENFTIDNIEHYPNSKLTLLNRYGETIYESIGYKNNWNGKIKGKTAPAGTYYYELVLNEPRNEIKTVKGFFSILY